VVALQAQEPASPYLGLWNRVERFDGASLDEAFADRTVVKASVVRLTLHAVVADDYPAFYAAMLPYLRASRLHDDRFTSEGLTAADADALVPGLLELLAEPRGKAEVEAFCGPPRMWWALRTFAPCSTPDGPAVVVRTAPTLRGVGRADRRRHGRATLVQRYLDGFGRRRRDISTFTMLRKPPSNRRCLSSLNRSYGSRPPTKSISTTSPAVRSRRRTRRLPLAYSACGTTCCSPTPTAAGYCPTPTAATSSAATATFYPPCSSTATSPACGAPSTAVEVGAFPLSTATWRALTASGWPPSSPRDPGLPPPRPLVGPSPHLRGPPPGQHRGG
jgi:hypothetical protein